MRDILVILFVGVLQVYGHQPKAKVKDDRKHEHHHAQHGGDRIHVRHSGLEDFGKGDEQGRNILHNQQFIRNVEHLKQHLGDGIDLDLENATVEELDYHFFHVHDNDGDTLLDGLELLAAIYDGLEEQFEDIEDDDDLQENEKNKEIYFLTQKAYNSVDKIILEDDFNKDGYLSIEEFLSSRHATKALRSANEEHY